MISSDAILYAIEFCEKYRDHNINSFLINDLNSHTEFLTPFMLVQYKIAGDKRILLSMFFDHELWDKKPSSLKPIKAWFKKYSNEYMCKMTTIPSIRKFLMRLQ